MMQQSEGRLRQARIALFLLLTGIGAFGITPASAEKVQNPIAIFAALDKVTGRISHLEIPINETVQFGALKVTPRVCNTRPPTEAPHTSSFVEVDEINLNGEVERIFTGWMFADSPGLHAVEHPVFDVWLTNCKTNEPVAPAGSDQNAAAPAGEAPAAEAPAAAPAPAAPAAEAPPAPAPAAEACSRAQTCPGTQEAAPKAGASAVDVPVPVPGAVKRGFEQALKFRAPYLDCPEAGQVAGEELRVEQLEAAEFETRHEIDERDLARVASPRKHALAEKRAAEMHAV
jgi:hypothetical protein